jgi:hypothetical protein
LDARIISPFTELFTANVFALMGPCQLYFLLGGTLLVNSDYGTGSTRTDRG